jgi:phage gpG-like protein
MATLDRAIHVIGADAVIRKLDNVKGALQHGKAFNARAIAVVFKFVQDNFKSEGGKVGGWVKLADRTIEQRQRRRSGTVRVLQDVGWLKGKWKHEYTDKFGALTSAVDYGIYHDSDEPRSGKLPQRRILPREDDMAEPLRKIADTFIRDALK